MVGETDVLLHRPCTLECVRALYDSAIRRDEAHRLCRYIDSQSGSPGGAEVRNPLVTVYHVPVSGTSITRGIPWSVQTQKYADGKAARFPLSF